jgi:hypothetical protein
MLDCITPELCERIAKSDSDSNGVACKFFKVGDMGLKTYKNEEDARESHNLQMRAYFLELAPEVLSDVFQIHLKKVGYYVYGFMTELVDVAYNKLLRDNGYDKMPNGNKDAIQHLQQQFKELYQSHDYIMLKTLLEANDFEFAAQDLHLKNWGWLNGEAVCIDFMA